MKNTVFFLLTFIFVQSAKLPNTFKKCIRNQPNFKQCLLEAANYNIQLLVQPYKELHLPSLKPLQIPALTIGSGKSAVAVEQQFSDCNLFGFENTKFKVFDLDFEKNIIFVDGVVDEVIKKCRYKLNGQVMMLPIQGEGDSVINLKTVSINGTLTFEKKQRKNKTYLHFLTQKFVITDAKEVKFKFDNLFNGDKAMGDNVNKILNDNAKAVFEDVKEGYEQAIGQLLLTLVNKFFSRVSLEDAFDE